MKETYQLSLCNTGHALGHKSEPDQRSKELHKTDNLREILEKALPYQDKIDSISIRQTDIGESNLENLIPLFNSNQLNSLHLDNVEFDDASTIVELIESMSLPASGQFSFRMDFVINSYRQDKINQHNALFIREILKHPVNTIRLYDQAVLQENFNDFELALTNPNCQIDLLSFDFSSGTTANYSDFLLMLSRALKDNTSVQAIILNTCHKHTASEKAISALKETLRNHNKTLIKLYPLNEPDIKKYIKRNKVNGDLLNTEKLITTYQMQHFDAAGQLQENINSSNKSDKEQFVTMHQLDKTLRDELVFESNTSPYILSLKTKSGQLKQPKPPKQKSSWHQHFSASDGFFFDDFLKSSDLRTKTSIYHKNDDTFKVTVSKPNPELINPDSETWPSYKSLPRSTKPPLDY